MSKGINNTTPRSRETYVNNVIWLVVPNKGAMYGWKNLNPSSYPFVHNELVGYSIFTWIHSELGVLPAGRKEVNSFRQKGELSDLVYAFDNGMIMVGLLNLFKYKRCQNF